MATSNFSLSRPNAPQQRSSSWPESNAPKQGFGAWPNLSAPPQHFSMAPTMVAADDEVTREVLTPQHFSMVPTMVAPMPQAVPKPKRRWRGTVAWSLWVFAGGLSAGPLLADYVDQGLEAGIGWLATWAPGFLRPYLPKPLEGTTPLPHRSNVARTIAAAPSAAAVARTSETPDQPKPTPEIAVQRPRTRAPVVVEMIEPTEPDHPEIQAQGHRAHGTHRKIAAAMPEPESATSGATPGPVGHKQGARSNPFDGDGHEAAEPAATERVAKAAAEPASAKSNPAKSGDALNDLMAGVVGGSGSKPKDRRNTSKEIDAMLKNVQKSEPAPPPERMEPAPPPSLTASEIAKVMVGVKTGANACGKRFGQHGVADLKLTVGKNGNVTDVAIRGKLADSPIAQCVAKAVRSAAFPPNAGLKFDYRIDIQ